MELFTKLEGQYGLPAGLLDSVWSAESGRGKAMLSPKGAQGHFQFMPATAKQYGLQDPNDLGQSAAAAARMYSDLMKQTGGDINKALAGYNWGIGNVQRKGMDAAPAETRNYIAKVTGNMQPQDQSSDEWAALAQQFAPASAQPKGGQDEWAQLASQFSAPAAQPKQAAAQQQAPAQAPAAQGGGFVQGVGNLMGGAVRGAGSIGATIVDQIRSKLADPVSQAIPDNMRPRVTNGLQDMPRGAALRSGMDGGLQEMGAQPNSWAYKGGQLAGEIAGTAGVGGVLGRGMAAVPALAKFAPVVQSGGLTLGPASTGSYAANLAMRAAGGAANGAATASLINPEMAAEGAIAGAAMPVAIKGAQYAGKGVSVLAKNALGRMTGTSPETVSAAYNAGQTRSKDFLSNMRGESSFDDVVESAKSGLDKMRAERGAQYRSGMADISADKTVLDFGPIDSAMQKVREIGSFKGVQTNKNAAGIVDELSDTISQWRQLNPAEYHTPEGLDALKRAVGDIRDATQFGTPARRAADSVYNSVKGEITNQAPIYSKVMGDYSKASEALKETERALSLGDKASSDTAIRKLQSLMRNNAQSNYGNRLSLAQQLEEKGGVSLTPAIAGQAMNTWMPRGMVGQIQAGGIGLGAMLTNPGMAAMLPLTSPRLVGEAAYKAGLLSSAAAGAGQQAGGLLSMSPQARQIGRGLLTAMPVAISTSQTVRQ